MIDMLIMALEFAIDSLNANMSDGLYTHWENRSGGFNNGQSAIYNEYLIEAIMQWIEDARETWPDADPDEYVNMVMSAFDYEVTDRAFSDTVMSVVDMLWEAVEQAQELQELIYLLEALDF